MAIWHRFTIPTDAAGDRATRRLREQEERVRQLTYAVEVVQRQMIEEGPDAADHR